MLEYTAVAVRGDPDSGASPVRPTPPELSILVSTRNELREGLNYLRSLCELRCRLGTVGSRPAAGAPAAEPLVPLLQEARSG
jgi:hypothetical protein